MRDKTVLLNQLRPYQEKAINMSYDYMHENPGKNPCIVMPTGSGKSWVIAGICENLMYRAPKCNILILSHRKELIEQDTEKILKAWPDGYNRVGLYCAGLGRHDINQITVASVQSIARSPDLLKDKIALTIIDEAHMIGKGNSTKQYRTVLDRVRELDPTTRMIGLTATPYRLGQGRLDEGKDALFDTCIEPVTIDELIEIGCLVKLRSKFTDTQLDLKGVRKQNGDYVTSELEARIDTDEINKKIVSESIERGADRQSWLFFCVSKKHAHDMCKELRKHGIHASVLLGDTPREERAELLERFRNGEIRALTSVGVLTTGFDAPRIDMLVMARPTLSPGLYVQMAGRGMRPSPETGKTDCLVLDFAGVVSQHGPIQDVKRAKKKQIPCPNCKELIYADEKICPACGYEIPRLKPDTVFVCGHCGREFSLKELFDLLQEQLKDIMYPDNSDEINDAFERMRCPDCCLPLDFSKDTELKEAIKNYKPPERRGPSHIRFNDDIMGKGGTVQTMDVASWQWHVQSSKMAKIPMLVVKYYPAEFTGESVTEFLCLAHPNNYARIKAQKIMRDFMEHCLFDSDDHQTATAKCVSHLMSDNREMIRPGAMWGVAEGFNNWATPPSRITYKIEKGYPKILERDWPEQKTEPVDQSDQISQSDQIEQAAADLARFANGEVILNRNFEFKQEELKDHGSVA